MQLLLQISDLIRHYFRRRQWRGDLALGRRAEDIAHRFLQRRGYLVAARNVRAADGSGELDLVAWQEGTLVFVEVKSRSTTEFGAPERAIGPDKQEHILRMARDYVRRRGGEPVAVRFDVVTVVFGPRTKVEHWPDAFIPPRGWFPAASDQACRSASGGR